MQLEYEIDKYLKYCKYQKELDEKTLRAYRTDLTQFVLLVGANGNDPDKETLNLYLQFLHGEYKQKTDKRKIASVKALFHYLEEEEIVAMNPFYKVETKSREEMVWPKIIPRNNSKTKIPPDNKGGKGRKSTNFNP